MYRTLSEERPFQYLVKTPGEPEPTRREGSCRIDVQMVTENRSNIFFQEPKLLLQFNHGPQTYYLDSSFLEVFTLAASTKDGRFYLDLESEWIEAAEAKVILQWVMEWLEKLHSSSLIRVLAFDPDAPSVTVSAMNEVEVMADIVVSVKREGTDALRSLARAIQRAADIAAYRQVVATRPRPKEAL